MKRTFEAFVLVLTSLLAMSAIAISAASAAEFHSSAHPQNVAASQSESHVLTTDAGTWTCKKAVFQGVTSAKTSPTLTLNPTYEGCIAFGFVEVPVHENGCAYVFHANGTTEIECPSGKKIEITAPFCTTTVGPQHIASGITYSNNAGKTDIDIVTNLSGIKYNECGVSKSNGSYKGRTTVTSSTGSIWYD